MPGKLRVPEWIVSQTSVRNTRGRNGIDGRWRSCRVRGSSGGGSPTRSPVLHRCHTAPDSDGRGGILAELFRAADKGRRHKTVGHSSARCDLQRLDGLASVSGFTRLRRAGAASSSRREPWHRVRGARALAFAAAARMSFPSPLLFLLVWLFPLLIAMASQAHS